MGSHLNFRNFGNASYGEGSGAKPSGISPLARQGSIYSLTFDEFQNTWGGGLGKDLGSMNMDELLKNIWTAEETQAMTNSVVGVDGSAPGGNLQRQGSLTLPRTLSQKTVDEVWKDLVKESSGVKDRSNVGANLPQRQQTLGEMTLEEFLAKAGVVREDTQLIGRPNNGGFFDELSRLKNANNNNSGLPLEFQQPNRNNALMGSQLVETNNNLVAAQPLSAGGIRSSQPLPQQHQMHLNQPQPQQQQALFPKSANVAFASPVQLVNNAQLASPGARGSAVGIADPSLNNNLVHGGGIGIVGLGTRDVKVATGSPANQISPDMMAKSGTDTPLLSPVPNMFGRGRKASAALEKVIERRHRRMIKNRESAARSRARKQAYTLELEAEVAKLKEMNQELQRKQAEFMEKQKNEFLETINRQWGSKRPCLQRTLTGPW
ncbi:DNA binding protein, putative [Ricinus communis]|uniref:DNA binding protein, putative n=1 Tax=Ricinus communis TaxID=3988 RepID=B9RYH3_RICCO|nr:DNA binding protein, putative [Ricinus communis]|eukprot:XP_015574413.1 bZIP transcription factor TRAB1 [Ricinus communis]